MMNFIIDVPMTVCKSLIISTDSDAPDYTEIFSISNTDISASDTSISGIKNMPNTLKKQSAKIAFIPFFIIPPFPRAFVARTQIYNQTQIPQNSSVHLDIIV